MADRVCAVVTGTSSTGSDGGQALGRLIEDAVKAAGWTSHVVQARPDRVDDALVEALALCRAAVVHAGALADARVAYALGVRVGLRPGTSIVLAVDAAPAPPGAVVLRHAPGAGGGPVDPAGFRAALETALRALPADDRAAADVLVRAEQAIDVPHAKTDRFRADAAYDAAVKARLAEAREAGADTVRAEHARLGPAAAWGAGIGVDLLLSYRAVEAWDEMVALVAQLPPPVGDLVLVREQHAFALNRTGRRDEAEAVLETLVAEGRADAETWALLGRCRKDRWEEAGGPAAGPAAGLLERAIEAYLTGFEADWRDAYPGINAVTLMELREPPDERRHALIPIVRYAVERRIARTGGDYWDRATLVELAVLARDREAARAALGQALAAVREPWEPKTTARNLGLIRAARQRRGEEDGGAAELEAALMRGPARAGAAVGTGGADAASG
jgi:tetratricopeptide (TPR) repeat protein